jgi:hypothetical protein
MKTIAICLFAGVLWGASEQTQPPKGAAGYASELAKLTGKYLKEVEKKVNAEQEAYEAAARLYASAHESGVYESLALDREVRAVRLAAQMQEGQLSVSDFLFRELPDYAEIDFQNTKVLFVQEMESHRRYLENLADLRVESKKIAALQAIFTDLSKKPDLAEWSKQLASFASEFDQQTKHNDCALSASRLPFPTQESARLGKSIEAAGKVIADPAADPDQKKENEALKKKAEGEKKVVDEKVTMLKARRDATGLFNTAAKTCK